MQVGKHRVWDNLMEEYCYLWQIENLFSIINQNRNQNYKDGGIVKTEGFDEGALLLYPGAVPAHPKSALLYGSGVPGHHARKNGTKFHRCVVQSRLPHGRRWGGQGARRHRHYELFVQEVWEAGLAGSHASEFGTFVLTQAKIQEVVIRYSL